MRISVLLLLCSLPLIAAQAARADGPSRPSKRVCFSAKMNESRSRIPPPSRGRPSAVETASGNLCTATLISPHGVDRRPLRLAPPGQLDKAIALRFVAGDKSRQYQTGNIETTVDSKLGKS